VVRFHGLENRLVGGAEMPPGVGFASLGDEGPGQVGAIAAAAWERLGRGRLGYELRWGARRSAGWGCVGEPALLKDTAHDRPAR
jgi:hypothetical protein